MVISGTKKTLIGKKNGNVGGELKALIITHLSTNSCWKLMNVYEVITDYSSKKVGALSRLQDKKIN